MIKKNFEPLYLSRDLINTYELKLWASQYFDEVRDDLHVTIAYSKQPLDWFSIEGDEEKLIVSGGPRTIETFGDNAFVLRFASEKLQESHEHVIENGGSFDFDEYSPHVTISYSAPKVPIEQIKPYQGFLIFGPEKFTKLEENYLTSNSNSDIMLSKSKIIKINEEQRVVFGWASVIEKDGKPIVDTQNHVISSTEIVKATTDFMKDARASHFMHTEKRIGSVIHSFPLTSEIAKSLGIQSDQYGWIVGVHVEDDATWDLVKSGKLASFSIGGQANVVERNDE